MSRNEFFCYKCRATVARIRDEHPDPRTLRPSPGTNVTVTDENRIILECPGCGTKNQFTWRTRKEPADTLAAKSQG